MEQICLFPIEDKIERAIQNLKMFEETALRMNPDGYYLAFSGGKDSQAVFHLAQMAGVKFTAHYHVTTVDPPELVHFIRKEYPEVSMEKPEESMWKLIIKKGFPPTRKVRYCCSELKERGGEGRFVITGVRWAESRKRKNRGLAEIRGAESAKVLLLNNDNDEKRRLIESCVMKGKRVLNPIIDWTDEEVWSFIYHYVHRYCCLYDEGFTRIGCIGCPLASVRKREKELARYPGYKSAYLKTFGEMLKSRKQRHLEEDTWESAEDVYLWWMYGTEPAPKQVPGQLSLALGTEREWISETEKMKGKTKNEWLTLYQQRYSEWQNIHKYGTEQMWPDGIALAEIRRELLEIQRILISYGVEVPLPEELPAGYMARADDIRKQARACLEIYKNSEDYQYLLCREPLLTDRQKRKTQILYALGVVQNLETAIEEENLVVMRAFGNEGQYGKLLSDTASKVKEIPLEMAKRETEKTVPSMPYEEEQIEGQMSIFDLAS